MNTRFTKSLCHYNTSSKIHFVPIIAGVGEFEPNCFCVAIIILKKSISSYFIDVNHLGVNGAAKTTNGNGTADMSSAGQTVSPQTLEAIKQQPWYFGHITRADCDNILTDKGQDGDFMVRESETNVSF